MSIIDDILGEAREAYLAAGSLKEGMRAALERVAPKIATAERERCAKIVDVDARGWRFARKETGFADCDEIADALDVCAAAIRALSDENDNEK